jgi:uncharacterized cupredoxin-like copper-binding protein
MRKFIAVMSLFTILALSLVACGGGSTNASTNIRADMQDFKFSPDEWTVPAGESISLELKNSGAVTHEWSLMLVPAQVPFDQADESNIISEFELGPGETQSVTFNAPSEPGDYQVVCALPGHFEAGMVGQLHVTQP